MVGIIWQDWEIEREGGGGIRRGEEIVEEFGRMERVDGEIQCEKVDEMNIRKREQNGNKKNKKR